MRSRSDFDVVSGTVVLLYNDMPLFRTERHYRVIVTIRNMAAARRSSHAGSPKGKNHHQERGPYHAPKFGLRARLSCRTWSDTRFRVGI